MAETDYFRELKEEKSNVSRDLPKTIALIDREIDHVLHGRPEEEVHFLDLFKDKSIKLRERVAIPVKEFPKYNFVGKLLGPKGNTLKRLQEQTGCRISILGKGSVRQQEEEKLVASGDPKYDHFKHDLHVYIEAFAPPAEAHRRLAMALFAVKPFLYAQDDDELRNAQFEELNMMQQGGTPMGFKGNRGGGANSRWSGGGGPMKGGPGKRMRGASSASNTPNFKMGGGAGPMGGANRFNSPVVAPPTGNFMTPNHNYGAASTAYPQSVVGGLVSDDFNNSFNNGGMYNTPAPGMTGGMNSFGASTPGSFGMPKPQMMSNNPYGEYMHPMGGLNGSGMMDGGDMYGGQNKSMMMGGSGVKRGGGMRQF